MDWDQDWDWDWDWVEELGLYRIGIIRLKEEEDATSDIAKHEKHHDIEQQ